MLFHRSVLLLALSAIVPSTFFFSQQADPKGSASISAINNDFVQKEFGSSCELMGIAPLMADLNGDGVEDIVIPARCKNPMSDQTENNFTVVDPYYSFYGYGNPKVTTQFSTDVPEDRGLALLVIHGAGSEAWRSATPAAKFAIVNLPYQQIAVKRFHIKKKKIMAIYVEETGPDPLAAALFWDGKKYRYEPMGGSME
jgi:hypothetical protein